MDALCPAVPQGSLAVCQRSPAAGIVRGRKVAGVVWRGQSRGEEEDAEGQLGHIYKGLLFPARVGECETIPVACLFSLRVRKIFQVHCGFTVCV